MLNRAHGPGRDGARRAVERLADLAVGHGVAAWRVPTGAGGEDRPHHLPVPVDERAAGVARPHEPAQRGHPPLHGPLAVGVLADDRASRADARRAHVVGAVQWEPEDRALPPRARPEPWRAPARPAPPRAGSRRRRSGRTQPRSRRAAGPRRGAGPSCPSGPRPRARSSPRDPIPRPSRSRTPSPRRARHPDDGGARGPDVRVVGDRGLGGGMSARGPRCRGTDRTARGR